MFWRLSGKAWGSIGLLIAAALGAWYFHSVGYEDGERDARLEWSEAEAEHDAEIERIKRNYAKALQEKQNEILDVERAWLEQKRKTSVVYVNRADAVRDSVEKGLGNRLDSDCRLDDDSLRKINKALTNSN